MSAEEICGGIEKMIQDVAYRIKIKNNLQKNKYGNQKDIEQYISIIEGNSL